MSIVRHCPYNNHNCFLFAEIILIYRIFKYCHFVIHDFTAWDRVCSLYTFVRLYRLESDSLSLPTSKTQAAASSSQLRLDGPTTVDRRRRPDRPPESRGQRVNTPQSTVHCPDSRALRSATPTRRRRAGRQAVATQLQPHTKAT